MREKIVRNLGTLQGSQPATASEPLLFDAAGRPITFQEMAADPDKFRAALIIPGARGQAPFSSIMAPFQEKDFQAMDPALLALAKGEKPELSRYWWERTKGGSKDTDATVAVLWLLAFSPRPLTIQVGAVDADQAGEVRQIAKAILRLNPWLSSIIEIQNWSLINFKTDSRCDILAADVAGSHGARPDLLILNELSHISKKEFAENLMDNSAKVPHGVVLICTNAGFEGSWQQDWRKNGMESERWYFSAFTETAPWLDPAEIAEARRRNSINRFDRLFRGQWVPDTGDAISWSDVERSIKHKAPLEHALPGWVFAAGLDIGLAQDATGLVVVGKNQDRQYRLAYARRWLPSKGHRVDLVEVEREVYAVARRFSTRYVGYDPFQCEFLAARLAASGIPVFRVNFTGQNLAGMATVILDSFASGSIELYDFPPLLDDLRRLRVAEKSYGMRLESPRGPTGHGDLATALSIAMFLAKGLYPPGGSSVDAVDIYGAFHGSAAMLEAYGPAWGASRGIVRTFASDDGRPRLTGAYDDPNDDPSCPVSFGYRPYGGR